MAKVGRKRGITLTGRDQELMKTIAKDGFIKSSDIRKQFWPDAESKAYRIRLRKLCAYDYLRGIQGDMGVRLGYLLGAKGRDYMASQALPMSPVENIAASYRTGYDHDVKLQTIRKILMKCPMISDYKTEGELQKDFAEHYQRQRYQSKWLKVPDAAFKLETNQECLDVIVELELTRKSNKRYHEICRRLTTSIHWDVVIFLVKNQALAKIILDHAKRFQGQDSEIQWTDRRNRFYFCTLDEFLAKELSTTFVGTDGTFSLRAPTAKEAQNL